MCSKIITEKNVVSEWDDISYKLGMEKGPWQQPTRTKYESSLYECWRTQHAWGIWMEVTEDTYIFVVDWTLKSKVETVPWSWEDRPHENLEDPHPQWQCARSLSLLFLTLKFSFACSLLFPYLLFKLTFHPNSGSYSYLFIWLKYWRFGCESFLHSEFFHLGSLWFLGKLMKSTYIRLVIWLFMTNYKLSWFSFNHFFFPEEQKKWNPYDFSFPFLLCSYCFFSFAIDSEPVIKLFLCCCLELPSKIWVI